ncbi:MAG: oxidoreductase [Pseudomonadota bacterium]
MVSDFGYRTTAAEVVAGIDLSGKQAVVTGAYSGIGLETARALAGAGADVVIACRDLPRAQQTAADLNAELNPELGADRVAAEALDLSDLASVRSFAERYLKLHSTLHILINNAAVMACPQDKTRDGFEMQFGTNHLGHFALFLGLQPALLAAGGARVVCLSSTGHFLSPVHFDDIGFEQRTYDPWLSYGQAKTANALMAVGIQKQFAEDGIEAFAVHPGGIMTNLQRHMDPADIQARGWVDEQGNVNELFKTTEQGASTSVWAATARALNGRGGRYLEDCSEAKVLDTPSQDFTGVMNYAVDPEAAQQLWDVSLALLESA